MVQRLYDKQTIKTNLEATPNVIASNIVDAVNEWCYNLFGDDPHIEPDLDHRKLYVYPARYTHLPSYEKPVFIISINFDAHFEDYDIINFDLLFYNPNFKPFKNEKITKRVPKRRNQTDT